MQRARNSLAIQTVPCHSIRRSCSTNTATRKGTKKMRRMVSAFGRFMRVRCIRSPFLGTRISLDDVASKLAPDGFRGFGLNFTPFILIPAVYHFGALMQQMDG